MQSRPSVTKGQHRFANVPAPKIERSVFDRSCGRKMSMSHSFLVPCFVDEALPGDTFKMDATVFARMATLAAPVMDNIYMDVHFWAVPNRLVWEHWENFCGAKDTPSSSTVYQIPQMVAPAGGYANKGLSDQLGLPPKVAGYSHSSLFHRAYALIWNTWYRDENLQDPVVVDLDDGPDDPADYTLLRRGKRKDYFTACLPWPQKGTAVQLPLGSTAPLTLDTQNKPVTGVGGAPTFSVLGGTHPLSSRSGFAQATYWSQAGSTSSASDAVWSDTQLQVALGGATGVVDLTSAVAATVNQFREALALQQLYEKDARGGTRYTEIIRAHFGVASPDARLQRPEYLGGGTIPVMQTPVPQTSETGTTAQGTLTAYGVAARSGIRWAQSFSEHCIVIGLLNGRADQNYQYGLPRMFSRLDREEFYWPELAHLGEQAVLNKEIYCQGTAGGTDDDDVFGYQERWAEYRYKPSEITGFLRSSYSAPLDFWHLAEKYTSLPVLGDTFIQAIFPFDRIKGVSAEEDFVVDCYFSFQCARPMPTYSVPGIMARF